MAQKVYYDSVNNKEVVDVSGVKDEAAVKAEFGLDASTQTVTVEEGGEHWLDNGTLKAKTAATVASERQAASAAKEAARAAKETAIKAKLGLSDQDFDDLKQALG
jgi:hypothetical protein